MKRVDLPTLGKPTIPIENDIYKQNSTNFALWQGCGIILSMNIKLSRGLKKHIRHQKARIRKEVGDLLEQERLIKGLVLRIRERNGRS